MEHVDVWGGQPEEGEVKGEVRTKIEVQGSVDQRGK
jgi:hypothetical protein